MAQDLWTLQGEKAKSQPVHGPPLQARVVATNRAVLANLYDDPGAHGNEQGAGKCKTERGLVNMGSRHGMAKVGRQTKPAEQGRCRQTRPADDPTGTGLEVNSCRRSGRYRPRSKTASR